MKRLIVLLALSLSAWAASITIVNDSPYTLTAVITAANGDAVGKVTISSQHQVQWQTYNLKGSRFSETPYTVVFSCENGDQFGVVSYVQPGAYVSARSAVGNQTCRPPKKEKEQPQQNQEVSPEQRTP